MASSLPELGDTPGSVRAYLRAVAQDIYSGRLEPAVGRELNAIAKAYLQVLRHEHDVGELSELRQMLLKAQELAEAGEDREIADRQHTKLLPSGSK